MLPEKYAARIALALFVGLLSSTVGLAKPIYLDAAAQSRRESRICFQE